MSVKIKIAPSILAADFACLGEQATEAEMAGADYLHIDVMDGNFVPNITMGPVVVEGIKSATSLPLNVHLMIDKPERYLSDFVSAGADQVIFHTESTLHLHRLIHQAKDQGVKVGIAVNPSTPLSAMEEVLTYVDIALVSTVNPGFAGQTLIPEALGKVANLAALIKERGYMAEIQVDGGINADTAQDAVRAGATILVVGSAIYNNAESVDAAMKRIRKSIREIVGP